MRRSDEKIRIRCCSDASLQDSYRRAAIYVDKILTGAKPGDIPVEQPLVINLKIAKTLGVTIPPELLLRADELLQ